MLPFVRCHGNGLLTFDPRLVELSIGRALSGYVLLEEDHEELAADLLFQELLVGLNLITGRDQRGKQQSSMPAELVIGGKKEETLFFSCKGDSLQQYKASWDTMTLNGIKEELWIHTTYTPFCSILSHFILL